jgi:hypothetical protein
MTKIGCEGANPSRNHLDGATMNTKKLFISICLLPYGTNTSIYLSASMKLKLDGRGLRSFLWVRNIPTCQVSWEMSSFLRPVKPSHSSSMSFKDRHLEKSSSPPMPHIPACEVTWNSWSHKFLLVSSSKTDIHRNSSPLMFRGCLVQEETPPMRHINS